MMRAACYLLILFITGCTNNTKIPGNIIPQPEMEKILWDMVQADRFATEFIAPKKDSASEERREILTLYENVFQLHGISHDEFIKSYKFYLSRPDITKIMFDSITTRAERDRTEMYKHKVITNKDSVLRRRDSLLRKKPRKP